MRVLVILTLLFLSGCTTAPRLEIILEYICFVKEQINSMMPLQDIAAMVKDC
jgi:hypothetical protein